MSLEFGTVYCDDGWRPALIKAGRKSAKAVYQDGCYTRVCALDLHPKVLPLLGRKSYTLASFARTLMKRSNALGVRQTVSKGAANILLEAITSEEK